MKAFIDGFKEFGENISVVVNSFLLFFVYVFGVGLSFLITRLIKRNLFEKDPGWKDWKEDKQYYRQF